MVKRNLQKYIDREDFVKEYFACDPETGKILWSKKLPNGRKSVGEEAGIVINAKHGRVLLKVRGAMLYAHHVAWFIYYGVWATDEIDHKNSDGLDNRKCNLREATRLKNTWNKKSYGKTGRGLKGAYRQKGENRWFGQIVINGKQRYLGRFPTEEEAHAAYCKEAEHHFGEFARFS